MFYIIHNEISNFKFQISNIDVIRNDEISLKEIKKRAYDRIIISPGPGDPADKKYFGVCADVILELGKKIPVLGVCLGMQGIAHYFGGKVIRAKKPMHGKTSIITHDGKGVFLDLPQKIEVMRYHSLVADPKSLPECLEISAVVGMRSGDGLLQFQGDARHSLLQNSPPSLNEIHSKKLRNNLKRSLGVNFNSLEIEKFVSLGYGSNSNFEIMGLRHKEYPIEGVQFHPESIGTEGGKKILENFLLQSLVIPTEMKRSGGAATV